MAHEIFEQPEFARLQLDGPGRRASRTGQQIHLEIADRKARLWPRSGAAARQRLQAGDQLGEGEGLGQVVVGARLEADHALVDLTEGAQDSGSAPSRGGPQRLG